MSDESVKIKIVGDASEFEAAMKGLGRVAKAGLATLTASVTAVSSAMVYATSVGSEYETSLAKVNTIADTSAKSLSSISDEVLSLSQKTGEGASELNEAVYAALSAGVDTASSVDFVSTATKLAVGGFTSAANSVDVLTTIINAYGKSAEDATALSDMLIQTQNKGKTTVDELASNMGKVIPTANAYGVEIDQLCSSYVIMTAKGIATAESTTYLNGLLNELGKSGTVASNVLKEETGKSFKQLMDDGMNLGGVLQILQNKADESGLSMGDMFGSAEAGKAAMTIASEGIEGFNEQLTGMAESTGATEAAFETMQKTTDTNLKKFKNNVKNAGIAFFDKFKEPLNEGLEEATEGFGDLTDEIKKGKLGDSIEDLGKSSGTLIKKLTEMGKKSLPVLINGLSKVIKHLPTITKLVGVGAAAWAAYKTATSISSIITTLVANMTAAAAAAGVETVTVNAATVAQYAWNTAIAANPIGLAAAAVGALVAGIGALVATQSESEKRHEEEMARLEEETQAIKDARDAYSERIAAIEESTQIELDENDRTKRLWEELQKVVDENGNVKAGYEERAEFITGELSTALGTEVNINNGVIQKYQDLQGEIDKLIEKRRAEILLSGYEEKAKVAMDEKTEAQKNFRIATTEAQDALEEKNAEESKLNEIIAERDKYQDEYNKAVEAGTANTTAYADEMARFNARIEEQEDAVDRAKDKLDEKVAKEKETLAAIEEIRIDMENYDKAYELFAEGHYETLNNLLLLSGEERVKTAGKNEEELMKLYLDGQEEKEKAQEQFNKATSEAAKEAWQAEIDRINENQEVIRNELYDAGYYALEGWFNAVDQGDRSWNAGWYLARQYLKGMKEGLDEHSPSKETYKIGNFANKGLINATKDGTADIVKATKGQADAMLDAYLKSDYMQNLVATAKQYAASLSPGILGSIFNPMIPAVAPAGGVTENTYNYITEDKGDTVVHMEVTLDGETVYQNQKRVSNNHGVNFSDGGDW